MKKSIITIFGSAVRTHLWMRQYNSLKENHIPFEIIYVGDRKPDFALPSNMRFIYSQVKPSQCCQIAIENAEGEFLVHTCDDYVWSPHALDFFRGTFERQEEQDKLIISAFHKACRYDEQGALEVKVEHDKLKMRFFGTKSKFHVRNKLYCPYTAYGMFIKKDFFYEIGGFDNRFICGFEVADLVMRAYEAGGRVVIDPYVSVTEIHDTKDTSLLRSKELGHSYEADDEKLYYSFWCFMDNNPERRYGPGNMISFTKEDQRMQKVRVSKTRSEPLAPYVNDGLLEQSQGPKGRWQ